MGKKKKKQKPIQAEAAPVISEATNPLFWIRAFIGPTFVLGGWGLMTTSFFWGGATVYLGFIFCLIECIYEPKLLRGSYAVQTAILSAVIIVAGIFSITVILVYAPIRFDKYVVQNKGYPAGTAFAGIGWDPHLTDLRVSVVNETDSDYTDLDISIKPDIWTYEAALLEGNTDCHLNSIGGKVVSIVENSVGGATKFTAHKIGDKIVTDDNAGDVVRDFLTMGGYRLICTKLPQHFTLEMTFALASPSKYLMSVIEPHPPPNFTGSGMGLGMAELSGVHNKFDLLDARPTDDPRMEVCGHYKRGPKTYSICNGL